MKKLGFLAAFLLIGGIAHAEQPISAGPSNYRLYKSSNIATGSNRITGSAYLHKVIISSPSSSTLDIYNAQGSNENKVATIQISTTNYGSGVTSLDFGIYLSSGIRTVHTAATTLGSAQLVFAPAPQQDYRIYNSSFIVSDTSTHTIQKGPVLLKRVLVLKPATSASSLRIWNQHSATVDTINQVADIDITTCTQIDFDVMLSSGLTVSFNPNASGEVMLIYKGNPSRDYDYWSSTYTTGSVTNRQVIAGRAVFGGVINGKGSSASHLKVYDASGSATKQIAELRGTQPFNRQMYDAHVSSGITVTSSGSGTYTILYRRVR